MEASISENEAKKMAEQDEKWAKSYEEKLGRKIKEEEKFWEEEIFSRTPKRVY